MRLKLNPYFWKSFKPWRDWLYSAQLFWLFLAVLVGACLVVNWLGCLFDLTRVEQLSFTGLTLEIAGVLTVAIGIAKKADVLGGIGPLDRISRWLRACPIFRQDRNIFAGTAHLTLGGLKANVQGTAELPPDASLEQRIAHLEQLIKTVQGDIREVEAEAKSAVDELSKQCAEKHDEIGQAIAEVRQQSVKAHVGEIGMEFAGLGWVIAGLVLATIPDFVVRWTQTMFDAITVYWC